MADDLCGPSNPAKGLVGHLDRNRALQQDRIANSSPVQGPQAFRSHNQAANSAAGDNAFASFTSFSAQPNANMNMMMPMPAGASANMSLRATSPATANHHAAAAAAANTSWVADFQRMRLATGRDAAAAAGHALPPQAMNAGLSTAAYTQAGPSTHHAPLMNNATFGPPPALAPSAFMPFAAQQAGPSMAHNINNNNHHQQQQTGTALASSTEEALDAAFAAYDDDFQAEMDQWMGAHGPAKQQRHDATHDAIMTEIADHQDQARLARDPDYLPQNDPATRALLEEREQDRFRAAAADVLTALADNNSAKFQNSSFVDLMRRISAREVVLRGDDLVDSATGAPVANNANANANDDDNNGKGKQRQDDDDQDRQGGGAGSASASAA